MRPVPRRGEGGRPQAGPESVGPAGPNVGHHGRLLVLCRQQKQGRRVGRRDSVRISAQPEEVHSWHEDGVPGLEEAPRASRPDRLSEGERQCLKRVHNFVSRRP